MIKMNEVEKVKSIRLEENLGLPKAIAKEFPEKYCLDFDDLFQEGCFGLIKAIDRFDPMKGKFSSFAYPIIKREMINWIRKNSRESSYPLPVQEDDEVREGHKRKTKREILLSLDTFDSSMEEEDGVPLMEKIGDEKIESPLDKMIEQEEENEKGERNKEVLSRLKLKESLVLQKKSEGATYKKIGKHPSLKVTSERVRQIGTKASRKARYLLMENPNVSIEEMVKKLQASGIDYYNEIEPILMSTGIICDEEVTVGERIKGPDEELLRKIEEDCKKQNDEEGIIIFNGLIRGHWEWERTLKMRGNRIVYPDKTKPRREDVFQAVTIMVALFEEKTGSQHWDLIEKVLYPNCPQVFEGGNIESWYYKREKEALKIHQPPAWMLSRMPGLNLISREERKKFILWNFRNTGCYGIAIPPGS